MNEKMQRWRRYASGDRWKEGYRYPRDKIHHALQLHNLYTDIIRSICTYPHLTLLINKLILKYTLKRTEYAFHVYNMIPVNTHHELPSLRLSLASIYGTAHSRERRREHTKKLQRHANTYKAHLNVQSALPR